MERIDLFSIDVISGNTPTRTGSNKLSISADSIDSVAVPYLEHRQRVSKSILKKSDVSASEYNNDCDGDTEKLILDNASTSSMCNEGFNQSPVLNLNAARFAKSGRAQQSNNNFEQYGTTVESNEERNLSKGSFGYTLEGISISNKKF